MQVRGTASHSCSGTAIPSMSQTSRRRVSTRTTSNRCHRQPTPHGLSIDPKIRQLKAMRSNRIQGGSGQTVVRTINYVGYTATVQRRIRTCRDSASGCIQSSRSASNRVQPTRLLCLAQPRPSFRGSANAVSRKGSTVPTRFTGSGMRFNAPPARRGWCR